MARSSLTHDSSRRVALSLGLAVAAFAAVFPLLPESVRPLNFALFGAIGLFVAGRVGLGAGLALMLGAKLVGDLLQWLQNGLQADYLPLPSVYAAFAMYALLGWALLRKSDSPLRIGATAFGASVAFFVVTNFHAWVQQVKPYGYTLSGLGDCYVQAIPFYRGTFMGDMLFTGVLFATYASLVRGTVSAPAVGEVRA